MLKRANSGFTLAELLIALAILGVIATFTIPKVLDTSTSGQNKAVAKEVAGMVSGAMSGYKLDNALASGTTPGVFTSYMNYVAITTVSGAMTTLNCSTANTTCLELHSGGVLQYGNTQSFGGTSTTHAIYFNVDPDGAGTAGYATFVNYFNGRLTTGGNAGTANTDFATTAGTATLQGTDPTYIATWD